MSQSCDVCEGEGHTGDQIIEVEDKLFCPNTLERLWTEEEAEEMTDKELEEVKHERLKLVEPARPAKYVIIRVAKVRIPPEKIAELKQKYNVTDEAIKDFADSLEVEVEEPKK